MKAQTVEPSVKIVMDAFTERVEELTQEITKLVDSMPDVAQPELAYHVNKLIRRWFTGGGQLGRRRL